MGHRAFVAGVAKAWVLTQRLKHNVLSIVYGPNKVGVLIKHQFFRSLFSLCLLFNEFFPKPAKWRRGFVSQGFDHGGTMPFMRA